MLAFDSNQTALVEDALIFDLKFGRIRDIDVSKQGDIYISTGNEVPAGKSYFHLPDRDSSLTYDVVIRLKEPGNEPEPSTASTDGIQLTESQYQGSQLFTRWCASCHHKNMVERMTAPPLAGSQQRWLNTADYKGKTGQQWLYDRVRNAPAVVKEEHPYGTQLYQEWNKAPMTPDPLTNEEIDHIFDYVEVAKAKNAL